MGRRSKKSKKAKQRQSKTGVQKQYSSTENIAYYFLAAIGIIVSQNLAQWVRALEDNFHLNFFDAYFLSYLPTKLEWLDVAVISISAILMALVATFYPARKAAEIEPIEAFQYD